MIKYNSEVNLNTIKEKDLTSKIDKLKKELTLYNISDTDISNIINNNYPMDICSYDIEKTILNLSICELIWYNNIYKQYKQYKNSLQRTYIYNNNIANNKENSIKCLDKFCTTMTAIVRKYH